MAASITELAIAQLGHDVKLIVLAYVKPFVNQHKNDIADAEAICETAQRLTMWFVLVKSEAAQASALVFRTSDLLISCRRWQSERLLLANGADVGLN